MIQIDLKNITDLPLTNWALRERIINAYKRSDPFWFALHKNLTVFFYKELENRVTKQKNWLASFFGDPGTGKSYAAIFTMFCIAKNTGIPVRLDSICFLASDLLLELQNADRLESFLLDEQVDTFGCLEENTKILTKENDKMVEKKLKDLYTNLPISYEVLSVNNKNQIEIDSAKIIDAGEKEIFELETEKGEVIRCTNDHQFFVIENGNKVEKKLSQLKSGDEIITFK